MPSIPLIELPFLGLVYLIPQLRQDPKWTYRQAFTNSLLRDSLRVYTALRVKTSLSLEAKREGDHFVKLEPAKSELYTGVAVDDEIKPETIGGTWYVKAGGSVDTLTTSGDHNGMIVLHFHGGSYVLGDGRRASCKFLVKTIFAETPATGMFIPQYRLACNRKGRFPAQLQDAITSYSYLVHTLRIDPSRIVLSGDSCGAHLALAFLRYITETEDRILPVPRCAWLFSPWCDIPAATDPAAWKRQKNARADFIPSSFPAWGAREFLGRLKLTEQMEKYVAPGWHPLALPCPTLVLTGGREALLDDHMALVANLRTLPPNESNVEFYVEDNVPHDVLMIAWIMGFHKEARQTARRAGEFLTRVVASKHNSE